MIVNSTNCSIVSLRVTQRPTLSSIPYPPYNPPLCSLRNRKNINSMDKENILDPRQEKYLNWLCMPASGRVPSSQEKYAQQEGIDPTTLRRWQKKPSFKAEWAKRVDDLQGSPERSQKLLDSLYAKALDGDNKAAQLYLQATNRLAPTQIKVEHSQKLEEISDAELDALIARAALGEKHIREETESFARELEEL